MRTRTAFGSASLALLLSAGLVLGGAAGGASAAASAVPACSGVGPVTTVVRDGTWLESSAFDSAGRYVYTDTLTGRITSLATPTAPRRSLGRVLLPGGMALTPDGRLALASGNTLSRLVGGASVFLLDPQTGLKTRIASKLVGANGLARAADGTIYTSDEYASQIDRIGPGGAVTMSWWHGSGGPNGLVLTPDGATLYASLANAGKVVAIDTSTGATRVVFRTANAAALPDGLVLDGAGRLYLALYLAGEVLRIDPSTGSACRLARGLTLPTSVALAPPGSAFDAASAYVTQAGAVKRIQSAVPAGLVPGD